MCKNGKIVISDNYHDIVRLLLITIIVNSNDWTISVTVKENIAVNRQDRLIAHPYHICSFHDTMSLLMNY